MSEEKVMSGWECRAKLAERADEFAWSLMRAAIAAGVLGAVVLGIVALTCCVIDYARSTFS